MFAENLKKLRKEKGLSQEEMTARLNVVGRTYGSWERNEREPDFSTLCKIADFFNVYTDLLCGCDHEIMIVSISVFVSIHRNCFLTAGLSPDAVTIPSLCPFINHFCK